MTSSWHEFVGHHRAGDVVDATVTKVLPFGAFVEVSEGVHGLLVEQQPQLGSTVSVRVAEIDGVKQRIKFTAV